MLKSVMDKLQQKYESEKKIALENQRKEYENQFDRFAKTYPTEIDSPDEGIINWLTESQDTEEVEKFRQSLEALNEGLMEALAMVREANQLSEELARQVKFNVTLQIPPSNLSPNCTSGSFTTEPSVVVNKKGEGRQTWSMEKMFTRLNSMREVHQQIKDGVGKIEDIGKSLKDPFYEASESHTLIGVASLYLSPLFHDITFEHFTPIITQEGKVAGKLLVQLSRVDGSFPNDRVGTCEQDFESTSTHAFEEERSCLTLRIRIRAAVGIPPALSHFLFCQYRFFKDKETIVVPSVTESRNVITKKIDTVDFRFEHERIVKVSIDDDFIDHCEYGALSVEVYGHKSKGFYSAREAREQRRKALVLADRYSVAHPDLCWVCFDLTMTCHHIKSRWSELVRKLEVWVEIQEMNEQGQYVAAEIQQRDDVGTGGIYQLRHGQQRRICVKLKPIHNTGNLPIVCEYLTLVEVGNPIARSKLQRPLDSFQEDDLQNLRSEWASTITDLKDRLDRKIHLLDEKEKKTNDDIEMSQSLLDQKNCVIDELNNALVPTEAAAASHCQQFGMEKLTPLLFLSLSNADDSNSSAEISDFLPLAGMCSVLPKEQEDNFIALPTIERLEKVVGSVAAWDSSMHNSKGFSFILTV